MNPPSKRRKRDDQCMTERDVQRTTDEMEKCLQRATAVMDKVRESTVVSRDQGPTLNSPVTLPPVQTGTTEKGSPISTATVRSESNSVPGSEIDSTRSESVDISKECPKKSQPVVKTTFRLMLHV